jgi:plasmid stabilization system protein ParE
MKVLLLSYAREDLKEIKAYLDGKSPQASKQVALRIKASLRLLSEQPYLGTIKEDEDILEWHIPGLPYTIPYRIVNHEIQILRVFHESQNKPSKWESH